MRLTFDFKGCQNYYDVPDEIIEKFLSLHYHRSDVKSLHRSAVAAWGLIYGDDDKPTALGEAIIRAQEFINANR